MGRPHWQETKWHNFYLFINDVIINMCLLHIMSEMVFKGFIPTCRHFTSFTIGEMVVAVSQKSRTFWQWVSSRTFERHFCGNPPQIFSPTRSTCILRDTTLPKRYLVPSIAFHMKYWEGSIWFDTTIVNRAFLMGKSSFDLSDANCTHVDFRLSRRHNYCSVFLAFRANLEASL